MLISGIGKGDKVFCQDLTFSASANPIAYVGAEPIFIDSERDTWNMDPEALKKAIALYGVPKAVVLVHLYGNPAKLDEITEICREHSITLIEDAAEALGSSYRGKACGRFGKFGILSFNGNKIITSSGGGMLLCEEKADAAHALKLATQAREPFPYYLHEEIGYNYRMSNICAGIGRGQMRVLSDRVEKKRYIYAKYKERLASLPLTFQPEEEGLLSNRWLTTVLIDEKVSLSPQDIISALAADNVEARHVWNPMHRQPVFSDAKFVSCEEKSVSAKLFERGVCLPSNTKMTDGDIDRVCEIIKSLF